jgi:hypothetical protein
MFVSIITDCSDSNALGRNMTRAASLFGFPPIPMAIENDFEALSDLEAGGHLIDTLDAGLGNDGVILVNKAPRSGKAKKWTNGTPFGYFWYKKTLVVSSVDGFTLSLVKKFKLVESINVFDIPIVMDYAVAKNLLPKEIADYIVTTQFRSFEFLPRVAKWIFDKIEIPSEILSINEVPDSPNSVWFADVFGNLKTTLLPIDVGFENGKKITFENLGEITCYDRLKDVPNGETGLIVGSSGLDHKRFLEIVIQGQSAKIKFNSKIGQELKIIK